MATELASGLGPRASGLGIGSAFGRYRTFGLGSETPHLPMLPTSGPLSLAWAALRAARALETAARVRPGAVESP